jgi:hypothetical protein
VTSRGGGGVYIVHLDLVRREKKKRVNFKLTFKKRGQIVQVCVALVALPAFHAMQRVPRLQLIRMLVPVDQYNLAQIAVHTRQVLDAFVVDELSALFEQLELD